MKKRNTQSQKGQSMVEYAVILAALTAALLSSGLGSIGTSQNDQQSLLKAIADKHRGHGYALSLSEAPEYKNLLQIAEYYDRLEKYPELSKQLRSSGNALNKVSGHLRTLTGTIKRIRAGDLPKPELPGGLPELPGLPSPL